MTDENNACLPPVRLPRALLVAARSQAAKRDETLSQVIRRALRAYVGPAQAPRQTDIEDAIESNKALSRNATFLAELDARNAPDIEYRAVFSTGTKRPLRRGETWRSRLTEWVASEMKNSA